MKKAFSLLELIFVIVLIGILSGIGFYLSRPDYTRQDAQYALIKIKEARYRAIGYDTGNGTSSPNGCITLTESFLEADSSPRHDIRSTITPAAQQICFDALGRPHDGNSTALTTLLDSDRNITFEKGTKSTIIRLFPQSGYAIIISCNH